MCHPLRRGGNIKCSADNSVDTICNLLMTAVFAAVCRLAELKSSLADQHSDQLPQPMNAGSGIIFLTVLLRLLMVII